ncbi:GNAT family N-acetyltransferase [Candidatus Saccharibacteria bacterium]|nr:GNAT family N-acetyltransferase [Candidatus Saccharibacteria bacterium]
MDSEIKQLINIDESTLNTVTNWMYNWWGIKDGYSFDGVKCFMEHSLQKDRLPQTYGLFIDNKIIGMFQLTYEDLKVRPDIYPWLANVYIDEKYRARGYGGKMLESVKEIAKNKLDFSELYLYTKHSNLYEKFGWKYVSDIDTFNEESRIEKLYKLDL